MRGLHRLRDGAPRLLASHAGAAGKRYRECWVALLQEFGELGGLRRLEAGRVCSLWVQWRASMDAWHRAQRAREKARGRTHSVAAVERLARRAGLADGSYSQALDRLRLLVAATASKRKPSPADLTARLRAGGQA